MATKITMPPGGQTTNESMIVKWHKAAGDSVKKGDVLFEIETDKAVMEIESFVDGIFLASKYAEGEYASTGEIVAYIGNEGEKLPDDFKGATVKENAAKETEAKEEKEEETKANKAAANEAASDDKDDEYQPIMKKDVAVKPEAVIPLMIKDTAVNPETVIIQQAAHVYDASKTLASPAARLLAKQEKVGIGAVGQGIPGQIVKRADVENHIKKNAVKDVEDYYYIDTSSMRRTIARRMIESVSAAPTFYVTVEVDMTGAMGLRQELNDYLKNTGVKVSFNDIIIKYVSKAIEKYPLINSTYGEDRIKVYKNVNFGLAVGLDKGLVVPVVKDVNKKSLAEIAGENAKNIDRAKSGKLQAAQMSGGTITLSNLGMFGVECFTAIINQPESCILAVGGIFEKPVIMNGAVVPRHMMSITATFDHRVIDGAVGAEFLKEVRALLEKPMLLLA